MPVNDLPSSRSAPSMPAIIHPLIIRMIMTVGATRQIMPRMVFSLLSFCKSAYGLGGCIGLVGYWVRFRVASKIMPTMTPGSQVQTAMAPTKNIKTLIMLWIGEPSLPPVTKLKIAYSTIDIITRAVGPIRAISPQTSFDLLLFAICSGV